MKLTLNNSSLRLNYLRYNSSITRVVIRNSARILLTFSISNIIMINTPKSLLVSVAFVLALIEIIAIWVFSYSGTKELQRKIKNRNLLLPLALIVPIAAIITEAIIFRMIFGMFDLNAYFLLFFVGIFSVLWQINNSK